MGEPPFRGGSGGGRESVGDAFGQAEDATKLGTAWTSNEATRVVSGDNAFGDQPSAAALRLPSELRRCCSVAA